MTTATATRKPRKTTTETTSKETTVTTTETEAAIDSKALRAVVAAYVKAAKSAAKTEADDAAKYLAAHQYLSDEANTIRSLEGALGIKRSQIQRHDLAGQALALGNGEGDPAVASVVLTVVTAAANRVGSIPTVREAIASCETTDQALALLPELKKAPAAPSNEGEGESDEADDQQDDGLDDSDFGVHVRILVQSSGNAVATKPLVALTDAERAALELAKANIESLLA